MKRAIKYIKKAIKLKALMHFHEDKIFTGVKEGAFIDGLLVPSETFATAFYDKYSEIIKKAFCYMKPDGTKVEKVEYFIWEIILHDYDMVIKEYGFDGDEIRENWDYLYNAVEFYGY